MPSMVRERGVVRGRWGRVPASPGARRRPGLALGLGRAPDPVEPSRLHRRERRPAEQVALAEFDAERRQRREVGPPLDAFGQEVGADPAAERHERLDEGLLGVVVADAVDDLAVDLDDRRPQRRDQREARVAGAGVVDREPEAGLAQGLDLAMEHADVGDRLLLGAFDGDLAGLEPGVADLGGQRRARRTPDRAG